MLKVKVNEKHSFEVDYNDSKLTGGTLNGNSFSWDVIEVKNGSFHVIKDNRSYSVDVVKAEPKEKSFIIKVNGNKYSLKVSDKYDELLHKLGLDDLLTKKVNEIKAPMPGLVLDIKVKEGDDVKKGDAILVLEAMKMENIIKSPADGTIKKINAVKGKAVEKNQVLINFA